MDRYPLNAWDLLILVSLVALPLTVVCSPPEPHSPDGPGPQPIVRKDGGATCGQMCAHLEQLGCQEARPTDAGSSCAEVCEKTLEAGFDLHPECVAAVERCEDVDRASQGCS